MVIKTYEDGSEMTGTGLAVAFLLSLAFAGIGGVAAVKYDNWKCQRAADKYFKKNNITK